MKIFKFSIDLKSHFHNKQFWIEYRSCRTFGRLFFFFFFEFSLLVLNFTVLLLKSLNIFQNVQNVLHLNWSYCYFYNKLSLTSVNLYHSSSRYISNCAITVISINKDQKCFEINFEIYMMTKVPCITFAFFELSPARLASFSPTPRKMFQKMVSVFFP